MRQFQNGFGGGRFPASERAWGRPTTKSLSGAGAVLDALCNPIAFLLTPGQGHDLGGADAFLPQMQADTLLADKAFDADKRVIEPLLRDAKTSVIPSMPGSKKKRPYDRDLFAARHLVENFFCRLKQFRAVATRYDKLAVNILAGVYAAAILIWLK